MENKAAVGLLGALAQETRLAIFRLLVAEGPEGMAAGEIGDKLGIPPATMSFHLKTLSHAGLIESRQQSRYVYYAVNFQAMNDLLTFLTENCCHGHPCGSDTTSRNSQLAEVST